MHALKDSGRRDVRHAIETLIKKGFPYRFLKGSIYYFKLPSQGSTQSCLYHLEEAPKRGQYSPTNEVS